MNNKKTVAQPGNTTVKLLNSRNVTQNTKFPAQALKRRTKDTKIPTQFMYRYARS